MKTSKANIFLRIVSINIGWGHIYTRTTTLIELCFYYDVISLSKTEVLPVILPS